MDRALSSLKVIDLTEGVAGPYCTKLLAGLGAEVIKVERPRTGDPARMAPPWATGHPNPEASTLFLYLNTGKASVTLDISSSPGRHLLRELLRDADVLVESLPPSAADELSLNPPQVSFEVNNPHLVVTSVTSFGKTGIYRDYKSEEITLQAMGGLMFITGEPDRAPLRIGNILAQYCAGQNAFIGILLALLAREKTGRGQAVDVSVIETVMGMLESALTEWSFHHELRGRTGMSAGGGWGIYPCKNGYVCVVSGTRDTFQKLPLLFNEPRLADPKYDSPAGRAKYRDEIEALILLWLSDHTKEETFAKAQALHLPFGYLCSAADLYQMPHLEAREFFVELDHPVVGKARYPGAPYKLSRTPYVLRRAPLLGEHNEQIYAGELGYSLSELSQRGII